jgi:hypothetical protein
MFVCIHQQMHAYLQSISLGSVESIHVKCGQKATQFSSRMLA